MMPIVFCASFVPCIIPIEAALNICNLPNALFTSVGREFCKIMYKRAINKNPMHKPISGEENIGMITFQRTPLPSHQWVLAGCDQIITLQSFRAAASDPPHKPPTSAWLELDGIPNHHVIRFQMIAPSNAQIRISEVTTFAS